MVQEAFTKTAASIFARFPMTNNRMAHFHTLRVADIHQETPECIVVGFDVPPELRKEFAFQHGQYVTLKLTVNGEDLRRSYSICSSPRRSPLISYSTSLCTVSPA